MRGAGGIDGGAGQFFIGFAMMIAGGFFCSTGSSFVLSLGSGWGCSE